MLSVLAELTWKGKAEEGTMAGHRPSLRDKTPILEGYSHPAPFTSLKGGQARQGEHWIQEERDGPETCAGPTALTFLCSKARGERCWRNARQQTRTKLPVP